MKQTILLVVTLLLSSVLFAQKYQPGIVKAKNVTYEIKEDKKFGHIGISTIPTPRQKRYPNEMQCLHQNLA